MNQRGKLLKIERLNRCARFIHFVLIWMMEFFFSNSIFQQENIWTNKRYSCVKIIYKHIDYICRFLEFENNVKNQLLKYTFHALIRSKIIFISFPTSESVFFFGRDQLFPLGIGILRSLIETCPSKVATTNSTCFWKTSGISPAITKFDIEARGFEYCKNMRSPNFLRLTLRE